MVGLAIPPVIESSDYSLSTTENEGVAIKRQRQAGSISSRRRVEIPWTPTAEQSRLGSQSDIAPATAAVSVTGAVFPSNSQDTAGTASITGTITSTGVLVDHGLSPRSGLKDLERPARYATSFEPHLRQAAVRKLEILVEQFRHAIGQPAAATVQAELRAVLFDIYRRSALNLETRNFATAISLLQDLMRPHWSEISSATLAGVSRELSALGSRKELSPRILEKFYADLVAVIGSRIYVQPASNDEEDDAGS
jgi:hypothetical protein